MITNETTARAMEIKWPGELRGRCLSSSRGSGMDRMEASGRRS